MDWIHLAGDSVQWRALMNTLNEPAFYIKCCEILKQLRDWRFIRKGSAPFSYFITNENNGSMCTTFCQNIVKLEKIK
jgi:hypothetical protein